MQVSYWYDFGEKKRLAKVRMYKDLSKTLRHAKKTVKRYAEKIFGCGNYRIIENYDMSLSGGFKAVHCDGRVIGIESGFGD